MATKYLFPNSKLFLIIGITGVIVSAFYYFLFYYCDDNLKHKELTCFQIRYYTFLQSLFYICIYFPYLLSEMGLTDFQNTTRWFLNQTEYNSTTAYFPYLMNLPIMTERLQIEGITTFIYTPFKIRQDLKRGMFFYIHGGGGVLWSPQMVDASLRYLAYSTDLIVVAPEYRKAPQYTYPQPQEDCLNVLRNVAERSVELRLDKNRIFLGGDSFGGLVSLYLAFKWKDLKLDRVYFDINSLVLIYPVVQSVNFQLDSFIKDPFASYFFPSTKRIAAHFTSLNLIGTVELVPFILNSSLPMLSSKYEERRASHPQLFPKISWLPTQHLRDKYSHFADLVLDPYCSILFQKDFSVLPRTLLITAEFDLLLDEIEMLRNALTNANVEVKHYKADKLYHGYFSLVHTIMNTSTTYESFDEIAKFIIKN